MDNTKTLADFVGGGNNTQQSFSESDTPNLVVAMQAYTNLLNSRYPVISDLRAISQSEATELAQFAIASAQIFSQAWESYLSQSSGSGTQNIRPHRQARAA